MNTKDFKPYNEVSQRVEELKQKCTMLAFEIATATTTKKEKEATRKWEEAIQELRTAVELRDGYWEGLKRKATAERLTNTLRYWEKEWSILEKQMGELQEKSARILGKLIEAREELETYKSQTHMD